jgi:hypothetical protein
MVKGKICDRCGAGVTDRIGAGMRELYEHEFENCMGEKVKMKLCWNCDWDVMNCGDPFEDHTDIYFRRWEEEYEYDPVNATQSY